MIKTIRILLAILFFAVTACQKEDFFDKFPPEIMFFENNKVENADFNQVTLPQDTT